MAVHLQAGASVNTLLDLWIVRPITGLLATPQSITYQIFDLSSAAKLIEPVQVFPVVEGDEEPVDLVADKLGEGHFVARWAADSGEDVGRHEIRWFVTLDAGSDPIEMRETFDVIAGAVLSAAEGYSLISELRAEGVPASITDAVLQAVIASQSRLIERITRRVFLPFWVEDLPIDGDGTRSLRFDSAVIAISSVKRSYGDSVDPEEIERTLYAVYNRHITHKLQVPDDRADPRVTLIGTSSYSRLTSVGYQIRGQSRFASGVQAYKVTGLFGYTDPDGSLVGSTPAGINEVCRRLVINRLTPLYTAASSGAGGGVLNVKSESTRDQSVTYGAGLQDKVGAGYGELTGDVLSDLILGQYVAVRVGMP